jgi:hypothetical protein
VVSAQNFGLEGQGQVRGNLFVTNDPNNPNDQDDPGQNPWQLRQWSIALTADGAPVFRVQPVGDNPIPALYGLNQQGEHAELPDLRRAFKDEFVELYVSRLTSLDRAAGMQSQPITASRLFARLGARFDRLFDAFQSTSQVGAPAFADDPLARAGNTPLTGRITGRLAEFVIPASCQLTDTHVLTRAGALTCGGCHQFSNNRPVAPNVTWPTTRQVQTVPQRFDFVHIDEQHRLSPALETHFLPERHKSLRDFLHPPVVAAAVAAAAPAQDPSAAEPSVTALRLQARETAARVTGATDREEAHRALADLAVQSRIVRERERELPGAFVPFRRTH